MLTDLKPQSALDTAGDGAERIAQLFHWMAVGSIVIWLAVVGLSVYAYVQRRPLERRGARLLIIGGGVALPTVVVTGLLVYGLRMLPGLLRPAPEGALEIRVTGHQYWWRVTYPSPSGSRIELANEIRLPVGAPVEFTLESADVIHAFWIPALGGKVDMIPGHRTRLRLEPTREGVFRGACAEYCGTSHAWMAFPVVVQSRGEFERWLREQAEPAEEPADALARSGQRAFIEGGCGACHSVRGTPADGVIGPDLTHVGSRLSIGAGRFENEPAEFRRWVAHTDAVKPGVLMPHFGMLPDDQLAGLAAYLEALK